MTTPSTANSKDVGTSVTPVIDKGGVGESATHSVVKGEVAPRLPHERDQSSDSGTTAPREVMHKAADDAEHGHTDVQRGPQDTEQYSDCGQARSRLGATAPEAMNAMTQRRPSGRDRAADAGWNPAAVPQRKGFTSHIAIYFWSRAQVRQFGGRALVGPLASLIEGQLERHC